MKTILTSEMRELDRRTIEEFEVPSEVLMDRAGYGVADIARHLARTCGYGDALIQLFAGRGNNGGDAFVAARHLKKMGFEIEVFFAGEASSVRGDALKQLLQMRSDGIELRELPTLEDWELLQATPQAAGDILIDGLLGTGITGRARGPVVGAIQVINAFARRGLVVSIDVPSGLNADSGLAEGDVVAADITVTMAAPKRGLIQPCALDLVGNIEVIDIGGRILKRSVRHDLQYSSGGNDPFKLKGLFLLPSFLPLDIAVGLGFPTISIAILVVIATSPAVPE